MQAPRLILATGNPHKLEELRRILPGLGIDALGRDDTPHEDGAGWLGEPILLVPGHCDPTVNLYDRYVVVRHGRVEGVWPIEARGLSQ